MDPMLEAFLSESRENLETAGLCFLQLEKSPDDSEVLNDLFRSIHTIKGASGLFEIMPLTRVVHAAEDLLDLIRSGELTLSAELVDLFLEVMDQINLWLDSLENCLLLPDNAESISQKKTATLRSYLGVTVEENKNNQLIPETQQSSAPEWISHISDEIRRQCFDEQDLSHKQLISIEYRPEENCFFTGDDPIHTVLALDGLVWFEVLANEDWPEPDLIDPFHCNVFFNILLVATEEEIRYQLRYVDEQIKLCTLSADCLIFPAGELGESELFSLLYQDAKTAVESNDWTQLSVLIKPVIAMNSHALIQSSALLWIQSLLAKNNQQVSLIPALLETITQGIYEVKPSDKTVTITEEKQIVNEPIRSRKDQAADELIQLQLNILGLPCEAELIEGRISSVHTVLQRLFVQKNWQDQLVDLQEAVEKSLQEKSTVHFCHFLSNYACAVVKPALDELADDPQRGDENKLGASTESLNKQYPSRTKNKVIKVDQTRIDSLMDLVGELVVAKNALPFLAKRAEEEFAVRPLAKEIKAQYAVINRLSEELQSAMMQVRMVPISSVFQRFPRLVRDLSRKLGKKINLLIEGEETEADKNIVEELPDPLIHIVRNSLDHGLETADVRVAAGKPATGTITLRATQLDDQVQIDIIDDGKGIDTELIKQKAYENGVITEEQLEKISEKEVLQLIFAPGLSTAEEVSDLSGRGVGMDVVRTVISRAGGSIDVSSELGKGTSIRLRLPLSMAISRVMMVEVGGQNYGIYMDVITETVRVSRKEIKKVKHDEVIMMRNTLVPLLRMRDLLGLEEQGARDDEEAILVITMNGEQIGLVIDEFHEGIDIILKPLEGVMASYKEYSGTALLGDGRVLLVLNLKELVL